MCFLKPEDGKAYRHAFQKNELDYVAGARNQSGCERGMFFEGQNSVHTRVARQLPSLEL